MSQLPTFSRTLVSIKFIDTDGFINQKNEDGSFFFFQKGPSCILYVFCTHKKQYLSTYNQHKINPQGARAFLCRDGIFSPCLCGLFLKKMHYWGIYICKLLWIKEPAKFLNVNKIAFFFFSFSLLLESVKEDAN